MNNRILDINKIRINTRIFDKNGKEAFDGDIIMDGNGSIFEIYWDERYQWSKRNHPENIYGWEKFQGSLTTSKFIVPEGMKWEIIERK